MEFPEEIDLQKVKSAKMGKQRGYHANAIKYHIKYFFQINNSYV